ncbi:hypothetical protein [Pseudomonas sp. KNUC1026]|uniref:hypothetical protein n=1 Tax=Pseudomonas sp. KNUC1026 TaxID=2893890 RepID=UPI001F21E10B|nr:hypothetical protein [Pseudomonas sp. KNUC1026]UFH50580.1 hypothetical protein LN139_05030 [Pseudomonas sp. KNUC1026]
MAQQEDITLGTTNITWPDDEEQIKNDQIIPGIPIQHPVPGLPPHWFYPDFVNQFIDEAGPILAGAKASPLQ